MNQLESALVLRLRTPFKWGSAIDATPGSTISESGVLHPVYGTQTFNPLDYQYRDRQLRYLDLINAAALVDVAMQVSDVWNAPTDYPSMEGPAPKAMPAIVSAQLTSYGVGSLVRYVSGTSTPYDARTTDNDLYGRDLLLHEILARACAIFNEPPITPLDSTGTVVPSTGTWSLADGLETPADINAALPLTKSLFKNPDRHLADRDNQLAAYVARVVQALKNPFAFAHRLYVQAEDVEATEPEVFVLTSDTSTQRVWTAEPALSGRNRIIYDIADQTLQWFRERLDEVHVPQLVALEIPGVLPGQIVKTLPNIPSQTDAQFWRQKAARVIPFGGSVSDELSLGFTASDAAVGGYTQIKAASLTVPGQLSITLDGALDAGVHRVAVLAVPNPTVEIAGASNATGDGGTDGGATFEVNVASGAIGVKQYLVVGGDGIVYNSVTYYSGDVFDGVAGITNYAQVGATSAVRQYSMSWKLALPPGAWKLRIDYTNISGSTTGFGVGANYVEGGNTVQVIKDTTALPFTEANGVVVSSAEGAFDVLNGNEFSLPIYWSYGDGQLHIRKLTFTNTDLTDCRIAMSGTIGTGEAQVNVVGTRYQPEVLLFTLENDAQSPQTVVTFRMGGTIGVDPLLPIQVKQVTVQNVGNYNATLDADGFQGWRQECVDRAERAVATTYNTTVREYGTAFFPTFYSAGTAWSAYNTEVWMAVAQAKHPRLRELTAIPTTGIAPGRQYEVTTGPVTYDSSVYVAGETFYGVDGETTYAGGSVDQIGAFRKSNPGHIGKPCLIPYGLSFNGSVATLTVNGTSAVPSVVAAQPWMIDLGFYTAQEDFWMPEQR